MTLKKLLVIVGLVIAAGALVMSVFNGINVHHVLTLTGMDPSVAVFQAVVSGAFSFVVYGFIGIVASIVIGGGGLVVLSLLFGGRKAVTPTIPAGKDAVSEK